MICLCVYGSISNEGMCMYVYVFMAVLRGCVIENDVDDKRFEY